MEPRRVRRAAFEDGVRSLPSENVKACNLQSITDVAHALLERNGTIGVVKLKEAR